MVQTWPISDTGVEACHLIVNDVVVTGDNARLWAPPDAVSGVVVHALTASRPKTRYLVGHDAKVRALMIRLLPDRWSDRLMTWILKLPH